MINLPFPKKTRFINFGYLPLEPFFKNIYEWFTGHPNPIKRVQAIDIMKAIDPQPNNFVLDVGCGGGYFTVEIAKNVKRVIGIDLRPSIEDHIIPKCLIGILSFKVCSIENLPFPDNHFDKIFASEIISCFEDGRRGCEELIRVLKPEGKLIVVNGLGHPDIKKAFQLDDPRLSKLKKLYPQRYPNSYEEYATALHAYFGNNRSVFMGEEGYRELLGSVGFDDIVTTYSPGKKAYNRFSWRQFECYLKTGNPVFIGWNIRRYLFWRLVDRLDFSTRISGGMIMIAVKPRVI